MLGIPSALLTLICFSFRFPNFARFFNDWQEFETKVHYVASAMETFAKRARLATSVFAIAVCIPWSVLLVAKATASADIATGCASNSWFDMFCAVAKNAIRVAGAHYVDACFVYLTLGVATCFEALKREIRREFTSDTGANPYLLSRRISQAKKTYLDLCEFSDRISGLFAPQLVFTVVILTYFCISTLYLAVMLGSLGGETVEIIAFVYIFLEVTARIVACSSAGHALTAKVRSDNYFTYAIHSNADSLF